MLLNHTRLTTDEWYKAAKTTKAYANYVKNGKAFLQSWAADSDGSTSLGGEEESGIVDNAGERSAFSGAFDSIGSQTPIALRLFAAYKCDHQGKGFSTAEGMRSAFKLYFERCVARILTLFSSLIDLFLGFTDVKGSSGSSTHRRSNGMETRSLTPTSSSTSNHSKTATGERGRLLKPFRCFPKISKS
jgi:hypothetical protein